jgi:hypothetical protein
LDRPEPYQELYRAGMLYREVIEKDHDPYITQEFKKVIESNLFRLLQSKSEFYNAGFFEENYDQLVNEFIEENIDADESDFIDRYINSQQDIISKTYKYYIELEGYESLEALQFVGTEFFDDFIRGSKKKTAFLTDRLSVLHRPMNIESPTNPFPDYFVSYGYSVYVDFISSMTDGIILAEMSFLVTQLKKDGTKTITYKLIQAWPVNISDIALDWGTEGFQEFTVTWRYDYFLEKTEAGNSAKAGDIIAPEPVAA